MPHNAHKLVFIAILSVMAARAASDETLYLVSACPASDRPIHYPSSVLMLDPEDQTVSVVRRLTGTDVPLESVQVNYESRIISVGGPTHFELVFMNQPTVKTGFDVPSKAYRWYPSGLSPLQTHLIEVPGKGLYETVLFGDMREMRLKGVNVTSDAKAPQVEDMPLTDYQFVTVGATSPVVTGGDIFLLHIYPGGRMTAPFPRGETTLPLKYPGADLSEGQRVVAMQINNPEVLAFVDLQATPTTMSTVHVYSKRSKEWLEVKVPGTAAVTRGFGPWVAIAVADVGYRPDGSPTAHMRKEDSSCYSLSETLSAYNIHYSGVLVLFNVDTQAKYTIETGEPDSEVVYTQGNTVYYRVNDALYVGQLEKPGVVKGRIVISDPRLFNAHWGFLSPPVRR